MRVLNVAEKNDAAKNIAALLSKGTSRMREGLSKFNKIYEFDYNIFGQNCKMVMTSVAGHLLGYEFPVAFRGWRSCNPSSLFEAPLIKQCPADFNNIKRTLEREVRTCTKLIIWTDCDREGENIGFEIIEVCKGVKPNIDIYRAKFSEITRQSVERAIQTLGRPNKNVSDAVDVRQQLDLRIGAAFTRFQTLHLQRVFPNALSENLISYGSCQFPTLGFVVERFKSIADFVPEVFWKIKVTHTKDDTTVEFQWSRVRLFDELACQVLLDVCKENPVATVDSIQSKPKSKWRPKPLDTVELEKLASRKLRISAKETMKVAEKLYTQGLISYPRTETNIFPKSLDLSSLVRQQTVDPAWGDFAEKVLRDGPNPFQGSKSDEAHPPIHPTKHSKELHGNEQRVYELITRHFLACLSKHAEGLETIVDISIADEKFMAKGLMIIALNYLEVYPYDKWSDKVIHVYERGERFTPDISMNEGETSPPDLLTEADLIALMEKHGIGTDATHAEHIETIKARLYVGLRDEIHFVPRTLGMGLVEGYDNMGFQMSKPHLRAELEADLKRICDGLKSPEEVLAVQIAKYKQVFESTQQQVDHLNSALQNYLEVQAQPDNPGDPADRPVQMETVSKCSKCGLDMVLRVKKDGVGRFISCVGYPACRQVMWLPGMVQHVSVTTDSCPTCGPDTRLLMFRFERGACYLPSPYVGCISGCDVNLLNILNVGTRPFQQLQGAPPPVQARHDDSGFESFNGTSTTQRQRTDTDSIQSQDSVACLCNKRAVYLTVRKQGPNLGRPFYKCDSAPNSRGCDFFQWADEDRPVSRRRDQDQQQQQQPPPQGENLGDNCYCALPSKRLVVMKNGPNKGRSFSCCSKPMTSVDRCNFFKWLDGDTPVETRQPDNSQGTGRKTLGERNVMARKRRCGLCGQEGHNRKNCHQR